MKGLQVSDGGVTHWPDWLHVGAGVWAPKTQLSVPQTVPGAYIWQAPVPSHKPSVPHDALPWSLQPLRGSNAPAAMLRHWPGEPGRLQLRQAPPHALSQQTPSTHCLDSQSLGSAQDTPGFLFPHVPVVVPFCEVATHWWPDSQSASTRHEPLQAPFEQRNGAQSITWASRQVPCPSQTRAVFWVKLAAQLAAPHGVFSGNRAQAPAPSQRPVVSQVETSFAGQRESGTPAPRSLQRPTKPASLHDRHAPVQATLQQ